MMDVKQKKHWYRRWWAITLFIIIGLAIIGNLFDGNNSSVPTSSSDSKSSSDDFCRSMIPERIKLECCQGPIADHCDNTGRKNCVPGENSNFKAWSDGTPIKETIWFEEGYRPGENVNYLYGSGFLRYEKTPIDTEGTVGEKISYNFMIILDPNDQSDAGFKVKSYKCCQNSKYYSCDIRSTSFKNW